jgi:hypothetical protein
VLGVSCRINAAPVFKPTGGPNGLLTQLTDFIRQGMIKKGKSRIDEIKALFGTLPIKVRSLGDTEVVSIVAYMVDTWTIPPQANIEGIDQPEPNPWQTRWDIGFTFDKLGVLTDVKIELLEGKHV